MYAADASHYRQMPIGVVVPRSAAEVEAAMAVCREHGAPVLMRGAGTSLAGQCCNVAVVLDVARYLNRILELDPARRIARVEPGVVADHLRQAAERHDLTFGPDPSTVQWCTLGGMIGNNACGKHSVFAGRTSDNVLSLDILTYDGLRLTVGATSEEELRAIIAAGGRRGEIYAGLKAVRDQYAALVRERFPRIPRRVSGFNLDELLPENGFHVARALVGTEGTCATVLEATVRLVPWPRHRVVLVAGYPDIAMAAEDVGVVMPHRPTGLEGTDAGVIETMRAKGLESKGVSLLTEGTGWLLIEIGGDTPDEAVARARAVESALTRAKTRLLADPKEQRMVWDARKAAVGATGRLADGRSTFPGWEDAALPPERLPEYLRDYRALLDRYGYFGTIYGHFGEGCIHSRIDFDLLTPDGVQKYRRFMEDAADLCVSYGGSLSGEHGDGQSRGELLPKMFGPELIEAFRRFKAVWDPHGKMNPGKVVDPYKLDENLRLGADYQPLRFDTFFQYPDDDGSFTRAAGRCTGIGKCTKMGGGTMCPSYMAVREEQHGTRGRARLLQEMTRGALPDGWQEDGIREALALCLSCKGCKKDCSAGVDMATYKAEFLAHHYEGRLRPRQALAFGQIRRWARLASIAPWLANAVTRTPGLSTVARALAGMAPQRPFPQFASRTFRRGFKDVAPSGPRVILWPDTFNDHFQPGVLHATAEVLQAAGFTPVLPPRGLCCGRPLYDFGLLAQARAQLEQILEAMRPDIDAGTPVVGAEPSCIAVFRDELRNFFPQSEAALKLSRQTFTLAEFLRRNGYQPPKMQGRVLFHAHCHQKSVLTTEPDVALLAAAGLQVDAPDTGCCGMAGSFGFHAEHYDVSVKIGERVLLPAVRGAAGETLVVTDGFSCREQIHGCTDRRATHLAELLAKAHRAPAMLPPA
jgi:FAD/FMN-containing dehydrogenase/Fe-S oxidoreductase